MVGMYGDTHASHDLGHAQVQIRWVLQANKEKKCYYIVSQTHMPQD